MKRWKCLGIAAMIALTLSGCPGNVSVSDPIGVKPASAGTTASPTDTPAPDQPDKYDPPVTLTRVVETDPALKLPPGDTYDDNVWTREIESALGVKLKTLWTADPAEYKPKLDLAVASGNIPDFFATADYDYNTLVDCYSAGLLAPLDDAYNQYASADFKSHQDYTPEGLKACVFNGKLYAIPDVSMAAASLSGLLWIRDDWTQKLGLSPPQSMNDVIRIAEAFTKNDPDGDGQADTFGLGLQNTLTGDAGGIGGFASGYHAFLDDMWIQDASGQYVYGAIQPEVKNALAALRELYAGGAIDGEFGVKDINKLYEDIKNNKIGVVFGFNRLCYLPFQDMAGAGQNAVWKPYPIPSADGKPVKIGVPWPIQKYYMVSKNCQHPEAVIEMANLFLLKAGTNASADDLAQFFANGGDDVYKLHPIAIEPPGREFAGTDAVSRALLEPISAGSIKPYFQNAYINAQKWLSGDPAGYGDYFFYGPEGANWIIQNDYIKNGLIIENVSKGADTPAMVDKMTILKKMQTDTFIKIIMGDSPDSFDSFITEWKNRGGDDMTTELNNLLRK